jgi:hypothetical protein
VVDVANALDAGRCEVGSAKDGMNAKRERAQGDEMLEEFSILYVNAVGAAMVS